MFFGRKAVSLHSNTLAKCSYFGGYPLSKGSSLSDGYSYAPKFLR